MAGAGLSYPLGYTAGENFHQLSIYEMPSHAHYYEYVTPEYPWDGGYGVPSGGPANPADWNSGTHRQPWGNNTAANGYDYPHENRPPFFACFWIMKIA